MTTDFNVSTPANAETSLSGMLDWEWHEGANYKNMCAYVWNNAEGSHVGLNQLADLLTAYIAETGGNRDDYNLAF